MVRFSCFNTHVHRNRSKKTLVDSSDRVKEDGFTSKSLSSVIHGRSNGSVNENGKSLGSTALERSWKSEEIKANVNLKHDTERHQVRPLKKSQSHGDVLYLDGRDATENGTDDGIDQMTSPDSVEPNGFVAPGSSKLIEGSPSSLYQKAPLNSDQAFNGSIFSVGDPHHADRDSRQLEDSSFSGERAEDSKSHTPRTSPVMVRSSSMPNVADPGHASGRSSPLKYSSDRVRSCDDLRVLDMQQREKSVLETDTEVKLEQGQDHGMHKSGGNNVENVIDDGYDAYGYSSSAKDWIVPVTDEPKFREILQGESSNRQLEFPSKDFKIKRIEEWVNDLQHVSFPDEADGSESPEYDDATPKEPIVLSGSTAAKVDIKLTPGMEAAKKYISSLSASSTTAQLVNHGLVVIPFLSAFTGLRALNLSGNAIVRITAGALPRGLHLLNLSKNSISTIEGLRELTRLRVLDLSYNRILRIGHGLASCSSLKELYLAGNKISEVEGLHRLLKLTVLDLRFNKISTAKCLGQLAANYNSLQAISLEGNPAQKNVGDDQLKKYLMGLLPNLAYFNRHAIKDASDRRLGVSTHQLERAHRSELKNSSRKSSLGAANAHKTSASATARRGQAGASQKRSKDRSSRLPPAGQKGSAAVAYENRFAAIDSRLSSLKSEFSMRRSRSEGTLGAF
ncbi:PREDICTED: uncharacterized protein LOC104826020 [Tarenaya hassleriana]|uniref:uncharacterized protein LOC104807123 n=1 Tax=Tarenaya hassleriana TaxID=28532 RepID=UPI00053CA17E|nr:PREDICTED: uncharacterized protein LOC104807123 [Tarenaya hassleriana]XP_010556815.1 PREDICTED: uncharacterized protein LOC104826020 [Tarenaya hassleriana]